MDDGLLEDDFVERELGTEKRDDFQAGDDAIRVGEGNLGGRLAAVDRDIAHVDLKTKRSGMDAGNFGAAPSDALDFGDESAADQRLE